MSVRPPPPFRCTGRRGADAVPGFHDVGPCTTDVSSADGGFLAGIGPSLASCGRAMVRGGAGGPVRARRSSPCDAPRVPHSVVLDAGSSQGRPVPRHGHRMTGRPRSPLPARPAAARPAPAPGAAAAAAPAPAQDEVGQPPLGPPQGIHRKRAELYREHRSPRRHSGRRCNQSARPCPPLLDST
jgi:hypothetical protein